VAGTAQRIAAGRDGLTIPESSSALRETGDHDRDEELGARIEYRCAFPGQPRLLMFHVEHRLRAQPGVFQVFPSGQAVWLEVTRLFRASRP
jgi:hypothetical protein